MRWMMGMVLNEGDSLKAREEPLFVGAYGYQAVLYLDGQPLKRC